MPSEEWRLVDRGHEDSSSTRGGVGEASQRDAEVFVPWRSGPLLPTDPYDSHLGAGVGRRQDHEDDREGPRPQRQHERVCCVEDIPHGGDDGEEEGD